MNSLSTISIPEPEAFHQLLSLKGRVAIVTGGTRGIGLAIVDRLAQAGASLIVTARNREALDEVEARIAAMGGEAIGIQADAANLADSQNVVDRALDRFGKIDILVNNAAVFPASLTIELSEETWDKTIDTDLKGAFFMAKFAATKMIEAERGGKIINTLSVDFFHPTGFLTAYAAAKGGLMGMIKSMAKEFAPYNIQVNGVIPGATLTQERIESMKGATKAQGMFAMTPEDAPKTRALQNKLFEDGKFAEKLQSEMPMKRPGYPDDLAKAVLFMASGMSDYITGTALLVDGGQTLV